MGVNRDIDVHADGSQTSRMGSCFQSGPPRGLNQHMHAQIPGRGPAMWNLSVPHDAKELGLFRFAFWANYMELKRGHPEF